VTVTLAIADDVLRTFPDAQIRLVVAHGLRNAPSWDAATERLGELESRVSTGAWLPPDEQHPAIASWHDAYRRFGTNPRRMRPSVDALGRRLAKNAQLPRINGAVDAYNSVSAGYGLPAGGFDLDRLDGDVWIRFASVADSFTPLGQPDTLEQAKDGEVVYAIGTTVLTRHWNHRDSDRTKVGEDTLNAVFILERIDAEAVPDKIMADAQAALADLISAHADSVTVATVDGESPSADL
jgi:DNA/RNA-binding domain of Phe-tRNA-synthetase-like protein